MNVTDNDYKRWLNMSKIICGKYADANDILQDTLLKITRLEIDDEKLTDNYIFVSIRNCFFEFTNKQKRNSNDYIDMDHVADELITEDVDLFEKDKTIQEKLDVITDTLMGLDIHEKKLYQLHFIWGLSQREIARQAGLGRRVIQLRVNKIKDKIRENYYK